MKRKYKTYRDKDKQGTIKWLHREEAERVLERQVLKHRHGVGKDVGGTQVHRTPGHQGCAKRAVFDLDSA